MESLEKLRQCGRYETYSTAKHDIGFHKRIGVTATYKSSSFAQDIALETLIFSALRILTNKHANLSAVPVNEDKSFPDVYLARLARVNLRSCVQFLERQDPFPRDGEQDEELDRLLMRQHELDFKDGAATKPVWRLVVVSEKGEKRSVFTATWFFHHVISDGGSAVLFHEEFLAALNAVSLNAEDAVEDPIVQGPDTTPLPPPFESLHPMNMSWPFFLHAIAKALVPSLFARRPAKLWSGNTLPADMSSMQNPQYRTLTFSAAVSKKLAQKCRAEKTSITATLQCLLAASLFTALPASQYDTLKINGPIAMRRFLSTPAVPDDQFTNATSLYETWHYRAPTTTTTTKTAPSSASTSRSRSATEKPDVLHNFSWASARETKAAIQAHVVKNGADNPIALLKYVDSMHSFLSSSLGKPRTPSVQLTNLGVYKTKTKKDKTEEEDEQGRKEEEPWSIGRMVYSTDAFSGAAIGVSVVSGGDGNLAVCFCWMEGAVEEGLVERVVGGVRDGVGGLVVAS